MDPDSFKNVISKFDTHKLVRLSPPQLSEILSRWDIVAEYDTLISDFIRILRYEQNIFLQEKTPKNEILLRKYDSLAEAKEVLAGRLVIYEKMWDGCGCKIDYYA